MFIDLVADQTKTDELEAKIKALDGGKVEFRYFPLKDEELEDRKQRTFGEELLFKMMRTLRNGLT